MVELNPLKFSKTIDLKPIIIQAINEAKEAFTETGFYTPEDDLKITIETTEHLTITVNVEVVGYETVPGWNVELIE